MVDTYKLKGLRARLVKEVEAKGITDELVLEALLSVPRHNFLESAFSEAAYEDRALPIADGQTISQPFTVAYQSQLLQIKKGMKVLEIGTGSGYQAAVLCKMGAKVFSIERHKQLHRFATEKLSDLGCKVRLKWGDGSAGWELYAPYDRIIVTAASPSIPIPLKKQLSIGGKLVIPVGDRQNQKMIRVTRRDKMQFTVEEFDAFRFVPLIGKFGWQEDEES